MPASAPTDIAAPSGGIGVGWIVFFLTIILTLCALVAFLFFQLRNRETQ